MSDINKNHKDIKIDSASIAVQFLYENYLRGKYMVNRKYQRKLVWTIKEKEAFIDSLMKHYSVPLFLFAEDTNSESELMEIIDGMQRMNSIISFIENEFGIEKDGRYHYFNLDTLASTKELKDRGSLIQKKPVLGREDCTSFVSYPLPISNLTADSKSIETVFRRINSFGRQLSEQEIRMAGAVGEFPSLVRHISSEIRGDVSRDDRMSLKDMSIISLSSTRLKYGLYIPEIFWVKNKIISEKNIRISRDEELVSQVLAYILLGPKTEPTKKTIDHLYHYESKGDEYEHINELISKHGKDKITQNVLTVHNILKRIADESDTPLMDLIYKDHKGDGIFRSYQILFLALYEIVIKRGLRKINYAKLKEVLSGIGNREFDNIGTKQWDAKFRQSKINAVLGLIGCAFSKLSIGDVVSVDYTTQIDNLLTRSRSEGSHFDFKQTCHDLEKGRFSEDLVKKIVKTLVAMVNNPISPGYVILGIADCRESAEKYKKLFKSDYKTLHNSQFFVTGVEAEIQKYHDGSVDKYVKRIKGVIETSKVKDEVKSAIKRNIQECTYYGHTVIVLSLNPLPTLEAYDDRFYIRQHNDCIEIKGTSILEMSRNHQRIMESEA